MAARIRDINPDAILHPVHGLYNAENRDQFFPEDCRYDYIVDAVDTVTAKLALITAAKAAGTPILSCMGTGNKLNPSLFQITDISKTSVCPLARIMRKECAKRGLKHVKVLFSTEDPLPATEESTEELPEGRRSLPGSVAFVPSVAGLLIAGEVVKDLIK